MYSVVLTFFELDLTPFSFVSLECSILLQFSIKKLDCANAKSCERFLKAAYNVIASDFHVLAIVFDLVVPKSQYTDIIAFLDDLLVIVVAKAALERDMKSTGKTVKEFEEATSALDLHVSGVSEYSSYANEYHPWLQWSTTGTERSPLLADVSLLVFISQVIRQALSVLQDKEPSLWEKPSAAFK